MIINFQKIFNFISKFFKKYNFFKFIYFNTNNANDMYIE